MRAQNSNKKRASVHRSRRARVLTKRQGKTPVPGGPVPTPYPNRRKR
jgi:hypothetical protein